MKKPKSLFNRKFWKYRGRCRNCGFAGEWLVEKSGMDWDMFYRLHRDYTNWLNECENCKEMAMFDLVAFSPCPPRKEK
jgi:hypothetical protein